MATEHSSGYCNHCDMRVMTSRASPNHLLHFLIVFLTCGMWVFVWIYLAVFRESFKCTRCGLPTGSKLSAPKR